MVFGELPIPQKLMDQLDGMKAKFLAVPMQMRMALERLGKLRVILNRGAAVPPAVNAECQTVEQRLKRVQAEWQSSADAFASIDRMRAGGATLLTTEGILLAANLAKSASYVIKNADASSAAVETLAFKYLTQAQRDELGVRGSGTASPLEFLGSGVGLAIGALGVFLLMRKSPRHA